jgi:hypothetical protein
MPTTQTTLPPPPYGADKQIGATTPLGRWLAQNVGQDSPLRTVDTTAGNYAENVPPASLNPNQEIVYTKTSSDGNTFTLNGVQGGPYMLNDQYDVIRVKSDGQNWWPIG